MTGKQTALPLYLQIAAKIKEQIEREGYRAGDRLPFENWFVEHYQVSRVTIRKSIDQLISDGIIERRPYHGLYVLKKEATIHSDSPIYSFGFSEDQSEVTSKILSFEILDIPDRLKEIFHYKKERKVYFIHILRYYQGAPLTIQAIYLNKELLPDLDIFSLKDTPLYEIIEKTYNLSIHHLSVSMSVSSPTPEQAEWLGASPADSLLQARDTLYLSDNRAVRYAVSLYAKSVNYSYTVNK